MRPVFAKSTMALAHPNGGTVTVPEGSHWADDDPIVMANPDMFSADARYGALFSQPLRPDQYPGAPDDDEDTPVVERTTANPGEQRHINRGHRR